VAQGLSNPPIVWNIKINMYAKAIFGPVAGSVLVLAALGSQIASAKTASFWCAISDEGASNCSFVSIGQCLAAVSGAGGYCMREAQIEVRPRAADYPANNAKSAKKDYTHQRDVPIDIHICRGC
jgi:hypothetical protein